MSDRQKLVDQLMQHEGLRLKQYMDSVGKMTIGCGRNLTDVGISQAEAMILLDHDIDLAIGDCATFPWFVTLDAVRQRVMIDLRFNLGPRRLRSFKRFLRLMAESDYAAAAGALRDSLWYRQVRSRGVRLVRMMATGLDNGDTIVGVVRLPYTEEATTTER